MSEKVGAVLVIGGGIAGMQSALDLADSGYKVYIVEKTSAIGGFMAKLDKTFPTNDCAMCIMAPKLVGVGRHANIELFTNATVTGLEGEEGAFKVRILKKARFVDEDKCTGCGICISKCPKKVDSEFDHQIAKRKAIYVPFLQAVPNVTTIDKENCIYLTKGKCGACKKYCAAGAVNFEDKDEELELDVGSIIVATGFKAFDPRSKPEYGFGRLKNVISSPQFERILNASGPFQGHVKRPSDGKEPKKVAFIQCCGSRDTKPGSSPFCSSVCCMYAIKEAVIAKEHLDDIDPTIFYIDMRAFGKEFEDYKNRAQTEKGLKLLKARVSDIQETPENDLVVKFVENGDVKEDIFDMVILSAGLQPPPDMDALSKALGIEIWKNGFVKTKDSAPMTTNVPGIYACGTILSPKDIPDTVAQASGAAALASGSISKVRGSLDAKKEYPEEVEVKPDDELRIGVFICHCGINIGSIVNVPEVVEYAKTLPGVAYAGENIYTCSADTQVKIVDLIKEHRLNRIIVSACTPRTHEPLFQETIRGAGLNPYLFEFVNIREHDAWVHQKDKLSATEKAKDLVRMGVAKATLLQPLEKLKLTVNPKALVIGGGVSGLTSALGIANQGYKVDLIEKENELGGMLRNIHHLIGGEDPQEILKHLIAQVEANEKIAVTLGASILEIDGYIGKFNARVKADGKEKEIDSGVVIVTTGAKEHKPTEYNYGKDPNIITQIELEAQVMSGKFDAKTVVMIQCVGSRSKDFTNCSRICCSEAVKNARLLKEKHPGTEVIVLHKDIRTYGFNEEAYREVRRMGVQFIRFDETKEPSVTVAGGKLRVEVSELIMGKKVAINPDLVVLSAGTRPLQENEKMAKMLKVPLNKDGFFLEAHMKLRPVDFATGGIFLAGLAHGPKFIDESISQAMAAASRAGIILSHDSMESEGIISVIDEDACSGCGVCIPACPYNAIDFIEKEVSAVEADSYLKTRIVVAKINPMLCKGCGSCAGVCPSQAVDQKGFETEQIMAMVRNACL